MLHFNKSQINLKKNNDIINKNKFNYNINRQYNIFAKNKNIKIKKIK